MYLVVSMVLWGPWCCGVHGAVGSVVLWGLWGPWCCGVRGAVGSYLIFFFDWS